MNASSQTQIVRCSKCGAANRIYIEYQWNQREPICGKCHTPLLTTTTPLIVTDTNYFTLVDESPLPVLLDLWAPWCGPCRTMSPIVDQLANDLAGRVRVAKLNTDENPRISQRFKIQGIPTLLILDKGKELGRIVGAQPRSVILQKLQEFL